MLTCTWLIGSIDLCIVVLHQLATCINCYSCRTYFIRTAVTPLLPRLARYRIYSCTVVSTMHFPFFFCLYCDGCSHQIMGLTAQLRILRTYLYTTLSFASNLPSHWHIPACCHYLFTMCWACAVLMPCRCWWKWWKQIKAEPVRWLSCSVLAVAQVWQCSVANGHFA